LTSDHTRANLLFLSNEAGATAGGAYSTTWETELRKLAPDLAAGVNQNVLHGTSAVLRRRVDRQARPARRLQRRGRSPAFSKATWTAPVSNDPVTIAFKQHIGAGDALRTGSYSKTLTFTLFTTTP
jgi:hypothetical protein